MFGILVSLTFHRNSVIPRLERVRESIRFLCTISARFLLCEALYVLCLYVAIRFRGDESAEDVRILGSCGIVFFWVSWLGLLRATLGDTPGRIHYFYLVLFAVSIAFILMYYRVVSCRVVSLVKSAYHLDILSRSQRSICAGLCAEQFQQVALRQGTYRFGK